MTYVSIFFPKVLVYLRFDDGNHYLTLQKICTFDATSGLILINNSILVHSLSTFLRIHMSLQIIVCKIGMMVMLVMIVMMTMTQRDAYLCRFESCLRYLENRHVHIFYLAKDDWITHLKSIEINYDFGKILRFAGLDFSEFSLLFWSWFDSVSIP